MNRIRQEYCFAMAIACGFMIYEFMQLRKSAAEYLTLTAKLSEAQTLNTTQTHPEEDDWQRSGNVYLYKPILLSSGQEAAYGVIVDGAAQKVTNLFFMIGDEASFAFNDPEILNSPNVDGTRIDVTKLGHYQDMVNKNLQTDPHYGRDLALQFFQDPEYLRNIDAGVRYRNSKGEIITISGTEIRSVISKITQDIENNPGYTEHTPYRVSNCPVNDICVQGERFDLTYR